MPLAPTIADVLDARVLRPEELAAFNGFGGLHGGLLAARLLRAACAHVPPTFTPLELTTHFLRPVREPVSVSGSALHVGRSTAVALAHAGAAAGPAATATGVFGSALPPLEVTFTVHPPGALVPLEAAERFVVPPELVPVSTRMEIRPATPALPYTGQPVPELCAWVRLTDAVTSPLERLVILADALAPSYAAAISELLLVPTARMTVRLTAAASSTDFEWVLVRAATTEAHPDRWLTEVVDVWTPDGVLLATASQLRLARP